MIVDLMVIGGWSSLRRPNLFSPREKRLGRKERLGVMGVYRVGFRGEISLVVSASIGLPYNVALRAALQLELGLLIVAFECAW